MAQRTAAERIREYKQLLDEGMITKEEFEERKKKILDQEDLRYERANEEKTRDGNVFSGHYFKDGGSNASGRSSSLSLKATSVLAYITWIGFIIAYLAGDREGAAFHLNQALVVHLFSLLSLVPVLGYFWRIFILICIILGIINASGGVEKEVPLIGGIRLL